MEEERIVHEFTEEELLEGGILAARLFEGIDVDTVEVECFRIWSGNLLVLERKKSLTFRSSLKY